MTETDENVNEEQAPETAAEEEAAVSEDAPAPAATPVEPEEDLSPKEARKRARSTHTGEARPERSIEERSRERAEQRARKAKHRRLYRQRQRERRAAEPRAESPAPVEKPKGTQKVRQGVVVSDKADKTITVRIDVAHRHRMYKKIVRTSSTLHAHDEGNEAHVGDTVRIIESRPLSRTKRWRLVEVLERAR
jgi:small subunit ribosomal protein S17